jgi:hypothetical protein
MVDNEEVVEFVDNLERLWERDEFTEVSYRIAGMYSAGNYRFIIEAMGEFKKRVGK